MIELGRFKDEKERILNGNIGEVELDKDGYIKWIRIDKEGECYVLYPLLNPNNKEQRLSTSKTR